MISTPYTAGRSTAGSSLLEALIAMSITAVVATVLLGTLIQHSRLARTQMASADLRQAMRVASMDLQRAVRSAGLGGLPWRKAVDTVQNVEAGTRLGRETVAEGSDILIVRGAFSNPVWRTDPANPKSFARSEARALLEVESPPRSAALRALQELAGRLQSSSAQRRSEILVLRGPFQTYELAIVRSVSFLAAEPGVVLSLGERTQLELEMPSSESVIGFSLAGLLPPMGQAPLLRVRSAALLEEHHFFIRVVGIRELGVSPGLGRQRRERRVLSRARLTPGSDRVWGRESGTVLDIAEGVRDLQVSLAVAGNWRKTEIVQDAVLSWQYGPGDPDVEGAVELPMLRLSVLGESSFSDRGYVSKPIRTLENHRYDEIPLPPPGARAQRRYRRLKSRVLVSLRNP